MRQSIVLLTVVGLLMLSGCGGGSVEGDLEKFEKCVEDGDLDGALKVMESLAERADDMSEEQTAKFKEISEKYAAAKLEEAAGDLQPGS